MKTKSVCGWKKFSLIFVSIIFSALPIFAQTEPQEEEIPAPPIVLSKDENTQIEAANGIKERTRISLQIAEMRLKQAEKLTEAADFDAALREVGGYQAAIQTGLNFLQKNDDNDNKKIRDNFRRLESAIRVQVPRLELIRRNTPGTHAGYIKKTLDFVRDARTSALESFFSDTVLQESPAKSNNGLTDEPMTKKSAPEKPIEPKKPND